MLREFVESKHCAFYEEAKDWQEALYMACQPLIDDGTIEKEYADDVVRCVKEYGPYIILLPGVAMPHSSEGGQLVHKTTISFMKLQKPVSFDDNDPDKYADLFFTLASCNAQEHLEDMQKLAGLLENEELLEELHQVKGEEDLLQLADKYSL